MKKMFLLVFVLSFNLSFLFPQSYLDNYEGIPMVTYGWTSNDNWLPDYTYGKIKEMGTDIYIAPDMIATKFDIYRNANLKLIPYQVSTEFQRVNHIARYTEAIYSVWEAEGFDNTVAEVELSPTSNATVFNDGDISGIKSNGNEGFLNSGPNYIQPATYAIDASSNLTYTVKFKLKVEPKNGNQVPLTNNTDNICRIEVTSNGNILASRTIKAYQFVTYGVWNNIDDEVFTLAYSRTNNASINTSHPVQTNFFYAGTQSTEREIFSNIEYKVYFYGTETDYLTLYVDNVIVNDQRGKDLLTNLPTQEEIINQANNFNNINKFATDQTAFDSTVVGWYAIDEPSFIDNFACVKKIDQLLRDNTNGKKLVTAIAGSENGKVFENSEVFRIDELIKRTGLEEVIMNNFIYNYPHEDNETGYRESNIENMLLNHLDKLNNYSTKFVFNLQVGLWKASTGLLEKIPTQEELLYTMNLGLLYGAKGIGISNYFYDSVSVNTTALCAFTKTSPPNVYPETYRYSYSPLWDFIKNNMSPRLKGLFGKKVKGLTQMLQLPNQDANQPPSLNYGFVTTVAAENNTQQKECVLDLGFFSGAEDTCFMVVNRYYSEWEKLKFYFQGLDIFKNWVVTNFVTNKKTVIVSDNNYAATYIDTIHKGDAGLYNVLPLVKYGGTLAASDNISGSLQMGGNIIVPSGFILTIAANSVINPNGFSIVSTGGTITIQSGATVNGAILKTGSTVKAIYPTMQAAISAAVSGQTVTVNIPQTVSGSFFIVPSGVTLSFGSNATVTFSSGRRISVYGNLTANGSTFRGNGTRGSWLGISFNSGSTGSIQSSTITDAQNGITFSGSSGSVQSSTITNGVTGIYMNNGTATIQGNTITNNSYSGISSGNGSNLTVTNCTLSNNGTGITANSITSSINYNSFLNNTNYGINATGISIYDYWYYNAFHGNGYAMVLNNASPWIAHDTICGNNHGVVINSSFPDFCTPTGGGFNAITYSSTPLFKADNSSTVVMGYWSNGGFNSVFGSELPDMEARNSSHIWADNTYWGSGQPAILADGTSWITTRTPLTYDPVPTICTDYSPQSLLVINSTAIDANMSSVDGDKASKYAEAITSGREGHFQKARKSLLTLINGEFDKRYSPLALLSFYEFIFKERYTKNKGAAVDSLNNELKDILAKVNKRAKEDSLRPFALRFLAREAALSNNTLEMLSYNKEIVANYPNSSNELSALLDLITYYTDVEQDVTKTDEYYTRMVKVYPDEDLTKFAAINLGKNKKSLKKGAYTEEEQLPTEYSLSNAYPNPFNPITTITYQIPKDGFVTLEIFDILGNKVTTLVDQQKVIGKYSVQFDASSLASGTYVYQLRVNDYTSTKKMLLLK